MQQERRNKKPAVPNDWKKFLNDDQLISLNQYNRFGWQIKFIRRPLFQDSIIVLAHPDGNRFGVLERDGTINEAFDLKIRD